MYGLFGKEVTGDDLATFLELAGLVPSKEEARGHPYWERALPHRATLPWYPEGFDRPARSIEELAPSAIWRRVGHRRAASPRRYPGDGPTG